MSDYSHQAFANFAAEVTNEARDRPLREAIDGKIRDFFLCFDNANWTGVGGHLSTDAKLIDRLQDLGDIYVDTGAIIKRLKAKRLSGQRTSHQLLLVDRGRVTCYVTHFGICDPVNNISHGNFCGKPQLQFIEKREETLDETHDRQRSHSGHINSGTKHGLIGTFIKHFF